MKKLLLILVSLYLLSFAIQAQEDTIRSLIFTEWKGDNTITPYVELTNVGNETLDLSRFTYSNWLKGMTSSASAKYSVRLSGTLSPGDSYVMMPVYDSPTGTGIPKHKTKMLPFADFIFHKDETDATTFLYAPEKEMWGKDSVDTYQDNILTFGAGKRSSVLFYNLTNGDSILVDGVNNYLVLEDNLSVAGVAGANITHTLFRKFTIRQGNPDWDLARGVDPITSEWIPVPHDGNNPDGDIFTTVGNHGNFHIEISSTIATVDKGNAEITVPWGTQKGDSIMDLLTIGQGMAWQFVEDPIDFADSAHTICQDGDILNIYAIGNTLEEINFKIKVATPANDIAQAFPKRTLNYPSDQEAAMGAAPTWGRTRYYVTEYGGNVLDTIGNIAFATRVDTLEKYIEWAPKANVQMIWVDGKKRVDLKNGDILLVTAENGTTKKQYYLDVADYVPSGNGQLSAIIWPDKAGYMEGWAGDTIPGFNPDFNEYVVKLPYGSTNIPGLVAIPRNLNAKILVNRAISLKGGISDRTTSFQVTAEVDTIMIEYKVIFEVDFPSSLVQEFIAAPFISEIVQLGKDDYVEIANPGVSSLDLSHYMIVNGSATQNPSLAIQNIVTTSTTTDYGNRYYRAYVPGYKFSGNYTEWSMAPGKLYYDPYVDPVLDPGDVFVVAQYNSDSRINQADIVLCSFSTILNPWGETDISNVQSVSRVLNKDYSTLMLFEILNDSILNGTKEINDPVDFKLIDIFGNAGSAAGYTVAGRFFAKNTQVEIERKTHIYKGVTTLGEGIGTDADNSQWTLSISTDPVFIRSSKIGFHSMNPVTAYLSTVSSLIYKVDKGYQGNLNIKGIINNATVDQFYTNLIKADTGQVLKVVSSSGVEKGLSDIVSANDTLACTSADLKNVTRYILSTQALNSDATLVAVTGSGLLISNTGNTGTISGFNFGKSVKFILDNVTKPSTANLNIIDGNNNLVPVLKVNTDTIKVESIAGDNIYFEVTAEDGVTVITYQLKPASSASDAYVLSDVYQVLQDSSAVTGIPTGTAVPAFLRNLIVVDGASVKVVDKDGNDRSTAVIAFDDFLEVTSGDGSVIKVYFLQFINEPVNIVQKIRGKVDAPTGLSLAYVSATGTELAIQWTDNSEFEYGFVVSRGGVVIDTVTATNFTDNGLVIGTNYSYSVYAFNELGNSSAAQLNVTSSPTSVKSNLNEGLSIYPTVTSDFIYFRGLSNADKVIVIDIMGKVIIKKNSVELGDKLNLQSYPNGLYLISVIRNNSGVKTFRVIKE
ncbi:MAG: T9SS type A sorting domain-containing protein [Bacteroidia bacterium]|nr:T9SS type A sorting domain-containing protein [Bacteroidia bacterium]